MYILYIQCILGFIAFMFGTFCCKAKMSLTKTLSMSALILGFRLTFQFYTELDMLVSMETRFHMVNFTCLYRNRNHCQ